MPKKYSKNEFIEKSKLIFGNSFNYSKVNYVNNKTPITLICKVHGEFISTPKNHLCYRIGCPICSGHRYNLQSFKERASKLHNNFYDYSKFAFTNVKKKSIIICPTHGKFAQSPDKHINGKQGCNRCFVNVSKKETEWLDYINLPIKFRNKTIKIGSKKYFVDGFNPNTNEIFEFYGDYWHGNVKVYKRKSINRNNKKTFGDLYKKTINREKELVAAGYKVTHIWENEFEKLSREKRNICQIKKTIKKT